MDGSALVRVVILYVHPLLGEGLARLLSAEPGVAADAVSAGDTRGTAAVLASRPDVVIVESRAAAVSTTVSGDGAAPLLLFVGIGGAAGTDEIGTMTEDPERIVAAVRDLKHARMALVHA